MKKFFLILAAVAMVLPGCQKIEESIDALENRIDKLEQETIPTIDEQIAAIQTSIKALEEIDKSLDESIKALESNDKATAEEIAALKEADKAIETKIEELKKYVNETINSTKDWVSATFATLEQLNALSSEVAALKLLVEANKAEAAANLANAISNLETSLKKWVGEQLSNYYTIAEIDAKILALQTAITNGDSALQEELNKLKAQLETTKSEVTEAYKKAIKEAIETNNGVIEGKIAEAVAAVNQRIDSEVATINAKISAIEARLNNVEAQVKDLLARIQSVSYIPEYADGKVVVTRMGSTSSGELSFRISPKDAVVELEKVWSTALSCEAFYPKTRAVSLVKLAVTECVAEAESGVITIKVSGEGLSEEFFAGLQDAKVALVISDGNNSVTSDYIPMIAKEVTDEIWYKTTDGQPLTPNHEGVDIFGANIVSNTYNEESGWFVLKFDGNVTTIGQYSFGSKVDLNEGSGYTLQYIALPNSITTIASQAFAYCCDDLISIDIPDSVTSIGKTAFSNLAKLERVTLGKNVETLGEYCFSTCSSLKEINIPEKTTKIPNDCFRYCESLNSITIPDSVITIGNTAFAGCTSLKSVNFGKNIESIGSGAFSACQKMKGSVVLPQSLKSIGKYAFQACQQITSVTLSDNLVEVGLSPFMSCLGMEYFYGKHASSDNRCFIFDNKLINVAQNIPAGEYALPDGITSLAYFCINYPQNPIVFVIPESVTDFVGDGIITGPSKIQGFKGKFATEDGLSLIKDNVLYGFAAYGVTKYEIPEGVTKAAYRPFNRIGTLEEIVIPSTFKTISGKFVDACKNLKSVYCKAVTPPDAGNGIFYDMEDVQYYIYVPLNSVPAYKAAEGWKDYADKIQGYNF